MNQKTERGLRSSIKSLEKLLFTSEQLCIPGYQRPYKWSVRNVNQLIDDILNNTQKSAYRLGTIVLHRKDGLNIVDGQQRLMTLSILAAELLKYGFNKSERIDSDLALSGHKVIDPVSLRNLRRNHAVISARIKEFDSRQAAFFFKKCEVVLIELRDISEAFQFFDGQNSRGLDLKPHDLLKAFHLREMVGEEVGTLNNCVELWEANVTSLPENFSNYFYKIKRWSQGRDGLGFSKEDIDIFKGIKATNDGGGYPFEQSYKIVHEISSTVTLDYPFQIDQPIINGRHFFEFVNFYSKRIEEVQSLNMKKSTPNMLLEHMNNGNPLSQKIIHILDHYKGRKRQGDGYLRNLLDCCLLYYHDKFGIYRIDEALIRFFFWAYALRLEKSAVQEVTVDKLAREADGFFRLIRDATRPSDIIQREIKTVSYLGDGKTVANIEEIIQLFKDQHVIKQNN